MMTGRTSLFVLAQLVALFAAAPAPLYAAEPTTLPASQLQLFSDYQRQIQVSYPANWQRELNLPMPQVLFIVRPVAATDGTFSDHASLIETPAEKGLPLKALANELLNQEARSSAKFEMGEEGDFDWNGIPARRATFSKTLLVWPVKTLWVTAVRENKLLVFAYNANAATFDQHLPQIEQVLKSVRWKAEEPVAPGEPRAATPPASRLPRRPATAPAATRPVRHLPPRPVVQIEPPAPITKSVTKDLAARISFEVPSNCVESQRRSEEGLPSVHDYQLKGPDGRPRATILIVAQKSGPNDRLSTESVKKAFLDDLRQDGTDVKVAPDPKPATINTRPAQVVRIDYTANGQQNKRLLYFTSKGGIAYAFILTAPSQDFDKVEPIFLDILKSVRSTQ